MIDQTKIEWCDFTVNFWEGCQKVGPGCDHCYAETRDKRFTGGKHWGPGAPRRKVKGGIAKLRKINRDAVQFHADHGHWPRVFCSSLSDVFDNAVSLSWRREAFEAIEAAADTRILLLTKRTGNVFKMVPPAWLQNGWPAHVGLMMTVVNQEEANRDIPKLLDLKARFGIPWVGLSVEPMLGAVDLTMVMRQGGGRVYVDNTLTGFRAHSCGGCNDDRYTVDWVICGGESGPNARPMHPDWVWSLRDQCKAAGTPFLFKQWGEWAPWNHTSLIPGYNFSANGTDKRLHVSPEGKTGGDPHIPGDHTMYRTGKKAAGRQLDGETCTQFPEALT